MIWNSIYNYEKVSITASLTGYIWIMWNSIHENGINNMIRYSWNNCCK